MFRKSIITLAILLPLSANATVCTDPTGLGQMISKAGQDALASAKETAEWVTSMTFEELRAIYEAQQKTMNELAATQTISQTTSNTANLNQQAKLDAAPGLCDSLNAMNNVYESLNDSWCDKVDFSGDYAAQLAGEILPDGELCDEETGECQTAKHSLAKEGVELLENATEGGKVDSAHFSVLGALPGMAEGGYTKTVDESERTKSLLKIAFAGADVKVMPRNPDGTPIDDNSSMDDKLAYLNWLRDFVRSQAGFNAAARVSGLTDPIINNGQATKSTLELIKDDVDYFTSPEMIKKLGNGEDKSCFRNYMDVITTEQQKEDWLATNAGKECKEKFVTPYQVTRINAQINARILSLLSHIHDSNLSQELLLGMQSQLLLEIEGG